MNISSWDFRTVILRKFGVSSTNKKNNFIHECNRLILRDVSLSSNRLNARVPTYRSSVGTGRSRLSVCSHYDSLPFLQINVRLLRVHFNTHLKSLLIVSFKSITKQKEGLLPWWQESFRVKGRTEPIIDYQTYLYHKNILTETYTTTVAVLPGKVEGRGSRRPLRMHRKVWIYYCYYDRSWIYHVRHMDRHVPHLPPLHPYKGSLLPLFPNVTDISKFFVIILVFSSDEKEWWYTTVNICYRYYFMGRGDSGRKRVTREIVGIMRTYTYRGRIGKCT